MPERIRSVGLPRETKDGERRAGLTPELVAQVTAAGASARVETNAGAAAGFTDDEYVAAGAEIVGTPGEAFACDLVVKVKEPNHGEVALMSSGQTLLTFLHLAGNPELRTLLAASGIRGIASERIEDDEGRFPVLYPMSVIAGRLATQIGAHYLEATSGGRGVMLGSVPGGEAARVVVVGAGAVGRNAADVAAGMGAQVHLVDIDIERATGVAAAIGDRARPAGVEDLATLLRSAMLVVGAVHKRGEPADRVVTRAMLAGMPPGAVGVDVAIDEGGCFETSRVTSHSAPVYVEEGVIHYCVPNIPSMVAHSATIAYVAAIRPHVMSLVSGGIGALVESAGAAAIEVGATAS